ncbi:hypothetical protein H6F50_24720 [Coleofasciculus sp. FACHB-712]|uniref:hypothetical protein n=1 Tax=Coleofasciculus sp. FACHB-712 TaxID=2692789 RepID=UPI001682B9C9|nr:hypothetical protein [Coleofasciculus sp. FACHB-712]MBD1945513.1 hypothetical protein [Coleofasciculus sp. FACHB-712]
MLRTIQADNEMTTRASQIAGIIQKRRPLAQEIATVETNLKQLSAVLRQFERQREELLYKVDEPSTIGRLRAINCSSILQEIESELAALTKLRSRFSRNTLNIGVVGRARQGKSRLLQSLTGLSTAEIPDGDDQHCTGVRSNIHHNADVETYAEVWFHTEYSFLDEVIAPYYKQLNLGSRPRSIQEFADFPLPELPRELAERPALAAAKYDHLCRYHQNFNKYRNTLLETSPRRIPQHEIREYVAQDTVDRRRIYFNYLAVREVKIVCPFPNLDIGQIALVDMPGLGDTGIGDAERMIKILGQDIDAVLFVRMPKSTGDFWAKEDVELYDIANSALTDLPIKEWSFMVLNHVRGNSSTDGNRRNCESLAETIFEKHVDVQDVVIADCANSEESQTEILDRVLNYLTHKIQILDRQYASACQDRLIQLHRAIAVELGKANDAWRLASKDDWFPKFLGLFDEIWRDITGGLEVLISSLIVSRDIEDTKFKKAVEIAIRDCRSDTGIPSLEDIERRAMEVGAYNIAYNQYLHEVRTHLSERFLSLDSALKESLEETKSKIVEVLIKQGKLAKLTDARGSEFLKIIAERIPENLIRLRLGFQTIATFDILYRGLIQHRIRKHLDVLTPNRTPYQLVGNLLDYHINRLTGKIDPGRPNAEKIFKNLHKAQSEALTNCEKELKTLFKEPSQAGFAIVEEFVDRVLRAKGVQNEWQIFLQEVASEVWADEFGLTMARTQLKRDWMHAVEQLEHANKSETLNLLR